MNMKKTMAAIAACAVATSAMATTATTAFAEGTVTYNLVHQTYKRAAGTVTHRAVINAAAESLSDYDYLNIIYKRPAKAADGTIEAIAGIDGLDGSGAGNIKWSINAYGIDAKGNKMDPVKFNNYVMKNVGWNANSSEWIDSDWGEYAVIAIPLDKEGLNVKNTTGVDTAASSIYCDVSITLPHNDKDAWNYGPHLGGEIKYLLAGEDAGIGADMGGWTAYKVEGWNAANFFNDTDAVAVDVTESNKTAVGDWQTDKRYPMLTDINTTTNTATVNPAHGAQGNYASPVLSGNDVYMAVEDRHDVDFVLNNVHGSASNILSYLSDPCFNLVARDKSYVNVVPVLNDIIANYDDVTFTFNTATEAVGMHYDDKNGDEKFGLWTEVKDNDFYKDANGEYILDEDGNKLEIPDTITTTVEPFYGYCYGGSHSDSQYTKFAQHLYNFYGDETTGYVYTDAYDWTGYTLFSGALVINGNLSMSLQDTNVFDFGASSISFNWADATEGATVNTYVNYLTKMQLATSTMWFWDNMTVTYANTEAEDVASDAGAEAEEDVIEDEVVEDEIVEDEIVEDEIVEDEPVVEEEPVEEAPAPVTNPSTGNAPIALAVIPVALAAAAVVAKKRG